MPSDRETIREFAVREGLRVSPDRETVACINILAFIDSLPLARDERLVELARTVKGLWARYHSWRPDVRATFGDGHYVGTVEDMLRIADLTGANRACADVLRRISELTGSAATHEEGEHAEGDDADV